MVSYDFIRYKLVPPVFVLVFTLSIHIFPLAGSGQKLTYESYIKGIIGNTFSWLFVFGFVSWAVLWLKMGSKTYRGPKTSDGECIEYKDNGTEYFIATLCLYLVLDLFSNLSLSIYENMTYILGSLNIFALILCVYLYASAKCDTDGDLPGMYLFYRGRDLNRKIIGMDVKQFAIIRIGLTLWPILCTAFFMHLWRINTFNISAFVTLLLQVAYSFKCFCTEYVCYHTIDVVLDRAGYYLCWGCIVWMPCFYTFNSYYYIKNPPNCYLLSILCAIIGLAAIYVEYKIDDQKFYFKKNKDNLIWGKKPNSIGNGLLLTSGFWGMARHLNYTCELIYDFCLFAPGFNLGLGPYLFPAFMVILILHRIYRVDVKCRTKYGSKWEEYCSKVPYVLIPYVF